MPIGATRSGVRSLIATDHGLVVKTVAVQNLEDRRATLAGELVSLGRFDEVDVTFHFASTDEVLDSRTEMELTTFDSPTEFYATPEGLDPESDYHFQAVAKGIERHFSVATRPPTDVSETSAELRGDLEENDFSVKMVTGDTIEFTTRPELRVVTEPPVNVSDTSARLRGELTDYYPD